MTARAAAGPLRRSLKGARAVAAAPTYTTTRDTTQRVHGGWRRVRIEFEYQSRNFQRHNHDPAGCDLIVCWEDNWPEAPLEVIELKSRVRGLGASFRAGG